MARDKVVSEEDCRDPEERQKVRQRQEYLSKAQQWTRYNRLADHLFVHATSIVSGLELAFEPFRLSLSGFPFTASSSSSTPQLSKPLLRVLCVSVASCHPSTLRRCRQLAWVGLELGWSKKVGGVVFAFQRPGPAPQTTTQAAQRRVEQEADQHARIAPVAKGCWRTFTVLVRLLPSMLVTWP